MNNRDPGDAIESLNEAIGDGKVDVRLLLNRIITNFGGHIGLADEFHLLYSEEGSQATKVRLMTALIGLIDKCTDLGADEFSDDPEELQRNIRAVMKDMEPAEREAFRASI